MCAVDVCASTVGTGRCGLVKCAGKPLRGVGSAVAWSVLASVTEVAAGQAQVAADVLRPRPFSDDAEERLLWAQHEDVARGMWEARNRAASMAASEFLAVAMANTRKR